MRHAALALALLAAPNALAPQTFRSGVEGIHVDALVLDGNRPLAGLRAQDFDLRDSGVPQQIDAAALEDVPLNVMLAFDASESMAGAPLEHLKEAAIAAVELMRPIDQGAVVTFNDYVTLRSDWTRDRAGLVEAIRATTAAGATALHDATYTALTIRSAQPGRTLVLVFSDGEDTASWLPGQSVIEVARRNDAVVYAVELRDGSLWSPGYRVDFHSGLQTGIPHVATGALMERFLGAIAGDTGGQVVNAARPEQLRERFVRIMTEFRTRYLLTYTPRGVEKGGWHPIDVKVKNRRARVVARRGYLR